MVEIRPFKGTRYAEPDKIGKLVSPPYDVIDGELKSKLMANPDNIVHIILGQDHGYNAAREKMEALLDSGSMVEDPEESIYVYEQEYSYGGKTYRRRGFIGLGKLYDFSENMVIPHEATLKWQKEDRFRFIKDTFSNCGLIFMAYKDGNEIETVLESVTGDKPLYEFKDDFYNTINRVWKLHDEDKVRKIQDEMLKRSVYIIDGHHRYETSLEFSKIMSRKYGEGPWNYRMMYFISLNNEGLRIYPTHRLVKGRKLSIDALKEFFDITPTDEEVHILLNKTGKWNYVIYDGKDKWHLSLKDKDMAVKYGYPGASRDLNLLDVSVLHNLILRFGFEITPDILEEYVSYEKDFEHTASLVDAGEFDYAIFQNAPSIDDFIRVADKGERMPQKTTFFYPKILTGLVVRRFFDRLIKRTVKISGGKLIKVEAGIVGGVIRYIKFGGDFFMHPENAIETLERRLTGAELEDVEKIIREFFEDVELIGATPEDFIGIITTTE